MRYGSIGHSFFWPSAAGASHLLGRPFSAPPPNPPSPAAGCIILVDRHARHCRCSLVALDDKTEAEITIPGIRTSLFMVFADKSRNCWRLSPDLTSTCMDGMEREAASDVASDPDARGKRMVRAAFVAADSNCTTRSMIIEMSKSTFVTRTSGMTSAGRSCMTCASSSLNRPMCRRSTSS